MSEKVFQIITQEIIDKIVDNELPWRKEFFSCSDLPKNLVSNKEYSGINTLLLMCQNYSSPYWLTFKQAKDLGGNIKKGEKHTKVVFWKMLEKENEEKTNRFPMMRYYQVWNLEQTENVKLPKHAEIPEEILVDPIETCEEIISGYKNIPEVKFGMKPCYNKKDDYIGMPKKEHFNNMEAYYSTMFHEMAHSTMHLTRMERVLPYAEEELIAEISAIFLTKVAGIYLPNSDLFKNNIAYLEGWSKIAAENQPNWKNELKMNPRMIIKAASTAQKVVNYIQNINQFTQEEAA